MLKVILAFAYIGLVVCEEAAVNTVNQTSKENFPSIKINNATSSTTNLLSTNITKPDDKAADSLKPPTHDEKAEEGSEENPINPGRHATDDDFMGNFKYYFVLLAFSSLSVIAIIIFKALRLRKSRAEIKYGRAATSDRSEVEPLGRSQWLEESSDENEDELFDINFLKNSRSQNHA